MADRGSRPAASPRCGRPDAAPVAALFPDDPALDLRLDAEQLGQRVKQFSADVIIFDNDLSPAQIRELEDIVSAKVLDRSLQYLGRALGEV